MMVDVAKIRNLLASQAQASRNPVLKKHIEDVIAEIDAGLVCPKCSQSVSRGTIFQETIRPVNLMVAVQKIDALLDPKAEAAHCDPDMVVKKVIKLLDEADQLRKQMGVIAKNRDDLLLERDKLQIENQGLRKQLQEKVRASCGK